MYEFVGGPENGRWLLVPDNLPSEILFPSRIPVNELLSNQITDLIPRLDAVYRKKYGTYLYPDGVEKSVRYEFEEIR
jgi:hypothetical protein